MDLPRPCSLFLFDLDGTLIDSSRDIASSLNLTLALLQYDPIPQSRILEFVGEGVHKLVERALRDVTGVEPTAGQIEAAVGLFFREYDAHLLDSTRLVDGALEALDGLAWGHFALVSNKPERFSRRLLQELGIADRFCVILGGDSLPQRKPDPAPLLFALWECGAAPCDSVMVGDSAVDILAGKAAGIFTCGISGGFRGREELERAGCDLIISGISELPLHFRPPSPK